jgi:hypothetical protein
MAEDNHATEVVQRLLNLLYLIRVTQKLGEDTLPAAFVDGYNQALDDTIDAIKCEFGILELEWLWEDGEI